MVVRVLHPPFKHYLFWVSTSQNLLSLFIKMNSTFYIKYPGQMLMLSSDIQGVYTNIIFSSEHYEYSAVVSSYILSVY